MQIQVHITEPYNGWLPHQVGKDYLTLATIKKTPINNKNTLKCTFEVILSIL